jgi:hypothetical protein
VRRGAMAEREERRGEERGISCRSSARRWCA